MHFIVHLIVHLTNQIFVGCIQIQKLFFKGTLSNTNALNILWRHLNAHSSAQYSNAHSMHLHLLTSLTRTQDC